MILSVRFRTTGPQTPSTQIAVHVISLEKGQIIKNTHHYRDRLQQVETLVPRLLNKQITWQAASHYMSI